MTKTRGPLAFSWPLYFTTSESDSFIRLLLALKMEEEATSHGLQMASRSWKKARKQILPLKPPKKCSPADPFWISDLQNYEVINLCRFKPLSVWQFLTAAIENRYTWFSRGQDGGFE